MFRAGLIGFALITTLTAAFAGTENRIVTDEVGRSADGALIRRQLAAWDRAIVDRDYDELEQILADEYFQGGMDRESFMTALRLCDALDMSVTESYRDSIDMRFYGDVAFVTGHWTQRGRLGVREPFALVLPFADFWVKRDGIWRCAASKPNFAMEGFPHTDVFTVGEGKADLVVLFAVDTSERERNKFRKSRLVGESPLCQGSCRLS
jgi:hypothetical protein